MEKANYTSEDIRLKTEGLNLKIDSEVLDDQRALEVSAEVPEKEKVSKDDKVDFENFKILYADAIKDKCIEDFGSADDDKLLEDTAKEMFLASKTYIPEEDKKADGEIEKKTESKKVESKSNLKLSESDIEYLMKIGHTEKDIPQIEEALNKTIYTVGDVNKNENGETIIPDEDDDKVITAQEARDILGDDKFLSGLSRSAFHWTSGRYNDDETLFVSFDSSKLFKESKSSKLEDVNPFSVKYKAMLNGKEVKVGDKIKDFRGNEHIFKGITNPGTPFGGMNGKVQVASGTDSVMEYYPSVFNIEIVKVDEDKVEESVDDEISVFDKPLSIEDKDGNTVMEFKVSPDGKLYDFENCEIADIDNGIRIQQIDTFGYDLDESKECPKQN